MAVRISTQAEAELEEIWHYLATESGSVEVGHRLLDLFGDKFSALSKHPFLGRRRDDLRVGLRSVPVGNYVVIYRVEGDDVLILHVLHGRRDIRSILQ
jgi:toxin ParE1/3/4